MKELDELILPDSLLYSSDHEWVSEEGELVRVGISDYAQDQLGDIVFVELPEVGDMFEQGDEFGTLESVKAVSEIYLPISGEIVAVNQSLQDAPELINEDPYGTWIVTVRPAEDTEFDDLLTREDYLELLKQ